jgi:hypothetical protein
MRSNYKVFGYIGLAVAAIAGAFYVGRARAAGIPDADVLSRGTNQQE